MKYFLLLLFCCTFAPPLELCGQEQLRPFELELSRDSLWGEGYPIVKVVYPYSSAYREGIRPQSLLLSIDGVNAHHLSLHQVERLLAEPQLAHLLSFRSVGRGEQTYALAAHSRQENSWSERELAIRFGLYSLEDTGSASLVYPFRYSRPSHSLAGYKSFSFAPSTPENQSLEDSINALIRPSLLALGMQEQKEKADIVIASYYSLREGEGNDKAPEQTPLYRWNPTSSSLDLYPILPVNTPLTAGLWSLRLGVQFLSYAEGKPKLLWSVESNEVLSEPMSLEEYASLAIPLMLAPYPGLISSSYPVYQVQSIHYNYTGIYLSGDDLHRIVEVDYGSPAYRSGLRPGDYLRRINGIELGSEPMTRAEEAYLTFVRDTESMRGVNLPLYPEQSQKAFRPFRTDRYSSVARLLEQPKYASAFTYLFAFRPYISTLERQELLFDIERGGETYTLRVTPQLRNDSYYYIK